MEDTHDKRSQFLRILNENTTFKYFRTATTLTSESLHPKMTVVKDEPFVLVPSKNSFGIYSLQDLKLQFIGPLFDEITSTVQDSVFTYVFSKRSIFKTYRGEIILEKTTSFTDVSDMLKFGKFLILQRKNKLTVMNCEDEQTSRTAEDCFTTVDQSEMLQKTSHSIDEAFTLDFERSITAVMHPDSYVNKILILFDDGTADLYNLSSRKTIFKFSFGLVNCLAQTAVIDTIGLGMSDGIIRIFNLKKNKLLFDIPNYRGKTIRRLTFKDNILSVLTDDVAFYDLELKKEIFVRECVFSSFLLNKSMAFISTKSSLEILTLDDMQVLKKRQILNQGITEIAAYSSTSLVMKSETSLFKLNVYRDEMNRFIKTNGNINKFHIDYHCISPRSASLINADIDGNPLLNPIIMIYSPNQLSFIDRELRFKNLLNAKVTMMKSFNDFVILGTKTNVSIVNIKSRRTVTTLKFLPDDNPLDCYLSNEYYSIFYSDKIVCYSLKSEVISTHHLPRSYLSGKMDKRGDYYFVFGSFDNSSDKELTIHRFDDDKNVVSKSFVVDGYCVDSGNKVLVGYKNQDILIFDISSGTIVETIVTNKIIKGIAVLDDLKFIAALDSFSDVHLLSNISHFNAIVNAKLYGSSKIQINSHPVKKESSFIKDLSLNFNLGKTSDADLLIKGLTAQETKDILQLITQNLDSDFFNMQKIIKKLILYKYDCIDKKDIEIINNKIKEKLDQFETSTLRCLGYMNIFKNIQL